MSTWLTDDEEFRPPLLLGRGHPGEVEASVEADQVSCLRHGLHEALFVRETEGKGMFQASP